MQEAQEVFSHKQTTDPSTPPPIKHVQRVDGRQLTYSEFMRRFARTRTAVIITNVLTCASSNTTSSSNDCESDTNNNR